MVEHNEMQTPEIFHIIRIQYGRCVKDTDAFVTLTNIFWYKMNMQKLAVLLEYTKFDTVPNADVVQIDADVSRGSKMFAQIPENRHCNG